MKLQLLFLLPLTVSLASAGSRESANYAIRAEACDFGGANSSSGNYRQSSSAGLISGTANGAQGLVVESGYVAQLGSDTLAPLQVVNVVSRKVHGASGTFDIEMPLTGLAGVECRTGGTGGNYQLVVTFASSVTASGVSIMSIDGQASATQSANGAVVTVDLTTVASAQTLGVTLTDVSNGETTADIVIPMSVLVGDTTGNGSVTASDIGQTKGQSGQPVSASNFRTDVTANGGSINTSDIGLVKSKSGTQLP